MQANPKQTESEAAREAQPAEAAAASAPAEAAPHPSPARALQSRLVRELSKPSRGVWSWHSAGLVLTTVLALAFAALMLNAGI